MFERARRRRAERREMDRLAAEPMPDVPDAPGRFTLEEARAELARQDCLVYGHVFDVIATYASDGGPSDVVCSRCGRAWTLASRAPGLSEEGRVALVAARSALGDGRPVGPNTAAVLVAELERLAGLERAVEPDG